MMYLIPRSYDGLPKDKVGILESARHDGPAGMIKQGYLWGLDNGQFTGRFSENPKGETGRTNNRESFGFYRFIEMMLPYLPTCKFIAAPDYLDRWHDGKHRQVKGDALKTLAMFEQHAPRIKELGYPVAYVAQDQSENYPVPELADALFVGGSTEWKLGRGAEKIIKAAQARRMWVHIGRVNSPGRFGYFKMLGCDSCDGTHIVFEPDRAVVRIMAWINQSTMFEF